MNKATKLFLSAWHIIRYSLPQDAGCEAFTAYYAEKWKDGLYRGPSEHMVRVRCRKLWHDSQESLKLILVEKEFELVPKDNIFWLTKDGSVRMAYPHSCQYVAEWWISLSPQDKVRYQKEIPDWMKMMTVDALIIMWPGIMHTASPKIYPRTRP